MTRLALAILLAAALAAPPAHRHRHPPPRAGWTAQQHPDGALD